MSEKTFDNNTYTDSWEIKDAADGAAYSFETTQQVSDALQWMGNMVTPSQRIHRAMQRSRSKVLIWTMPKHTTTQMVTKRSPRPIHSH
ncbi:hypothetical protein MSKU3_1666 [Komagataeibacter oboediens]|nr:hypothetical protein MSKU3_1666 [Komagataeibacter oboediens]